MAVIAVFIVGSGTGAKSGECNERIGAFVKDSAFTAPTSFRVI